MKKAYLFACRFLHMQFYFLPTFRYGWGPCGCWHLALIWGNISLEASTTCDPEFLKSLGSS